MFLRVRKKGGKRIQHGGTVVEGRNSNLYLHVMSDDRVSSVSKKSEEGA